MLNKIIIVIIMDMQLPNQTDNTHKEQLAKIKDELNNMDLSEKINNPITNNPTPKPVKESTPQLKTLPKKSVNPKVGPLFVSINKFNEIKSQIVTLKQESSELRNIVEQLKSSRDSGHTLLKQAVEKMDTVEKSVENINSIIKV